MNIRHASSISCGECIRKLDSLFWQCILICPASYLRGRISVFYQKKIDFLVYLVAFPISGSCFASYFILQREVCKIANLCEWGWGICSTNRWHVSKILFH